MSFTTRGLELHQKNDSTTKEEDRKRRTIYITTLKHPLSQNATVYKHVLMVLLKKEQSHQSGH